MKQIDKKIIWKNCIGGSIAGLIVIPAFSFVIGLVVADLQGKAVDSPLVHYPFFWSIVFYLLFLFLIWTIAKYSHHFYRYELAKKVLKIEKGIIWKKYINIPYNKIQNVDISRGIWDHILKLSTLHIQTAGLSYPSTTAQEGKIPGLSIEIAKGLQADLVQKSSVQ